MLKLLSIFSLNNFVKSDSDYIFAPLFLFNPNKQNEI